MKKAATRMAAITALALSLACHDSVMSPGGGTPSLTVSNADPMDGNGTLDAGAATLSYETDQGVQDLDKLTLSALDTTGRTEHAIEIYWLPGTGEVRLLQHFWGPLAGATSGATRCAAGTAHVCNPMNVFVDPGTKTLVCNGIVLQDISGGTATSTLTGTVVWDEAPSGGDHH